MGSVSCRLVCWIVLSASLLVAPAFGSEVRIEVVEHPETDVWTVTYDFGTPILGVTFQTPLRPGRSGYWELIGEGLGWSRTGDLDRVVTRRGAFSGFSIRFQSNFRSPPKGYELNVSYTDGSRLLYTGHLSIEPSNGGPTPDHRWRFSTTDNRNIVVLDRSGEGSLEWLESAAGSGNGTYAYFGGARPERRERMTHLADPGLPEWMREQVETLLPTLFNRFARITGVELEFVPLVLLSYRPGDGSGLTFKGGTLDGLAQIAAEGREWERRSPEAESMWLERTAHEVFHFWTGQMFVTALDDADEWLTEGGADYYAMRTLVDLGLVDETTHRRRLIERANACLVGLDGRPLMDAVETGAYRNLYHCGSTLWLWASRAAESSSEDSDPHAFVRSLLRHTEADRVLTTYGFLETLHRATGGYQAGAPLAQLILQGTRVGGDLLFLSLMNDAGIEVELVSPAEAMVPHGLRVPTGPHPSWLRLLRARAR